MHPVTRPCRFVLIPLGALAIGFTVGGHIRHAAGDILLGLVALAALLGVQRLSRRQQALAELYASLSRCSNDIVILLDEHLSIFEANDRALASYGYTREEMTGMDVRLLRACESPTSEEIMRRLDRDNGSVFESVHRRKDGSTFPLEISARRVVTGGRMFYQAVGRDITERRRTAERMAAYADELRQKNEELEHALATAREATEMKSRFLANMSHEIRTPIHGVLGMTELLLCTRLDAEQREYADSARRSAQSLLVIVNDILDLSKIEAGKLELECILFDLWSTVEEVAGLVAFRAYGRDLELTCMIQPDVPRVVRGDPARLRQVLTNLAGNAVKFTEQGEVAIRVETVAEAAGGTTVRFTVADTGVGIPLEQQGRLFGNFVQGDASTTRRYGGTGLGLAISRHLAGRMGGQIGFESVPGRGSTFWFTALFEKEPGVQAGLEPAGVMAGLRVLVVDDKAASRMVVRRYLESWGCRAVEAAGAEEALATLVEAAEAGSPFALTLVHLYMPERDGTWLAAKVREDARLGSLILLAVTSVGLPGESARLRQCGFAANLAKPVRPSQLYGRILEVLQPEVTETPDEPASVTMGRAGRRVLLAEDNEINQKIVIRLLEKSGCRAGRVANGQEAVEAVRRESWDLVLMDVQMPEMDGFTATAEIRRYEAGRRHTPIAAMTANAMTGDREKCLAAGMDDYISKPVRLDDLQRMLNRWLG